jgi:hypothetical protein
MPKHTLCIGTDSSLCHVLFAPIFQAQKRCDNAQKNHRPQTLVRAIASH